MSFGGPTKTESKKSASDREDKKEKKSKAEKQILFRTSFRNTILDVLLARGYRETEDGERWDFNWADVGWVRTTRHHPSPP